MQVRAWVLFHVAALQGFRAIIGPAVSFITFLDNFAIPEQL